MKGEFGYNVVEDGLLFRYGIPMVKYHLKLDKDGDEYYVNLGAETIKLMGYYLDYDVNSEED